MKKYCFGLAQLKGKQIFHVFCYLEIVLAANTCIIRLSCQKHVMPFQVRFVKSPVDILKNTLNRHEHYNFHEG